MCHKVYDLMYRQYTLMDELQHRYQCMLNERPARRSVEIGLLLFFQGVRRMVCGYDIDSTVKQTSAYFCPVSGRQANQRVFLLGQLVS